MARFLSLPCSFLAVPASLKTGRRGGGSEIEFGVWVKPIRGKET